jgi:hypothetical protein
MPTKYFITIEKLDGTAQLIQIPNRAISTVKYCLSQSDDWKIFQLHSEVDDGCEIQAVNYTPEYSHEDWEENIIL